MLLPLLLNNLLVGGDDLVEVIDEGVSLLERSTDGSPDMGAFEYPAGGVVVVLYLNRLLSETVQITESVTRLRSLIRGWNSTLQIVEGIIPARILLRRIADTEQVTETSSKTRSIFKIAGEAVQISTASVLRFRASMSHFFNKIIQIVGIHADYPDNPEVWLIADDLDASYNDNDTISTDWPNIGNESDAGVQGTPIFKTGVVNTHDVVRFDGSTDYFRVLTISEPENVNGLSIAAVMNLNASPADQDIPIAGTYSAATDRASGVIRRDNTGGNDLAWYDSDNGWKESSYTVSSGFHVVMWIFDYSGDGTVEAYVDSYKRLDTSVSNALPPYNRYLVGFSAETGDYFHGDIAELLVYDRALTNDERDTLYNRLSTKYDL